MLRLITLLLTSSMTVMAGATIAPALPQIAQFFKDVPNGEFWVKLMLTLPALFTAIGGPFAGAIIDRFGRKRLLAAAVALYGVAGGSGFVLNSLPSLLVGRAFLGLSVAAIMTTSVALIADYYQGSDRNRVMGIQAAFMGFGGVAFLTLGGVLADMNWRMPFLIYLSAFAILPLVILTLQEPKLVRPQAGLQSDAPVPMPGQTIAFIYALTFLTMVAFYMIPVQLPFYVVDRFQVSNTQSGLAIATSTLASAIASLCYGNIRARLNFNAILVVLYLLLGAGYIAISAAPSYSLLLLALVMAGLGLGLVLPNMNVWLNAITPVAVRGKVLGGVTTAMFLGQFFSPILTQPIAQSIGLSTAYGAVGAAILGLAIVLFAGGVYSKRQINHS